MDYPNIIRDTLDFTSDTEVCNIGYNEGTLEDGRPYRVEVWSSYGITNATIFISILDLENASEKAIKKMLIDNKIIELEKDEIFLSINVPLEGKDTIINKLLIKIKDFDI